jgi:putative N6-adenine-specific DNA methylase
MIELVATCMFGLEKALGEEIDALGCKRIETIDGRVTFAGEWVDVARANIHLRCAERVLIKIGAFHAASFVELFDGTAALPWEDYIGVDDAFPVKGHAIKSQLFSVPDCQKIIKKAIVSRMSRTHGVEWFSEEGTKYQVEFFIFKDVATLMIDTSGVTLHKRGYRPEAGIAPLRETLAAALVMNAHLREDVLLWDPFCGSGTIAIEAAMMMAKIAPGLNRHFLAEDYDFLPMDIWARAREEAKDLEQRNVAFEAYASDIDESCLAIAAENAARAGVSDKMKIFRQDARQIAKLDRRATILCNPPYGERLLDTEQAEKLYREIGRNFNTLYPWQIYILSSCETFERFYGRRADKIKKYYNGTIPCYLYQFYKPQDAQKAPFNKRPPQKGNYGKKPFVKK